MTRSTIETRKKAHLNNEETVVINIDIDNESESEIQNGNDKISKFDYDD